MYPHGDLSDVELQRAQVRDRIRLRRRLAELQLARLAEPVRRLDHMRQTWQRIAPMAAIAAVPVALFAGRRVRVLRWIGPLLRLAPVALSLVKFRRAERHSRPV
jgi:hypothetical protein